LHAAVVQAISDQARSMLIVCAFFDPEQLT